MHGDMNIRPAHEIRLGDALTVLRSMESESVQCCVTSPPYFGLRDYGVDGQIGLEATPAEFVARLVEVFEEVRRVLKKDGTLWLNLGDSYFGGGYSNHDINGESWKDRMNGDKRSSRQQDIKRNNPGIKPKDLVGIPWRVAFALQEAGWWLRQDIIWHKPNPMPESVTDRCTKAHEYIFLLTKSAKYFYDAEAVKETVSPNTHLRLSQDLANQIGSHRANGGAKSNGPMKAVGKKAALGTVGVVKSNASFEQAVCLPVENRNKRSVWTVTTQPYSEAHFATFPPKLIEPCILAGSREGDLVLDPFCGSGTTGLVSLRHRRNFVGIELNPEYIKIAEKRLSDVQVKLF